MKPIFINDASTTLASGISDTDTTISVVDASGFPTISGSDYFYCVLDGISDQIEVVKVTAVVGNDLTVVRAQDSTVAIAHAAGVRIENRVTSGALSEVVDQTFTPDTVTIGTSDNQLTIEGAATGFTPEVSASGTDLAVGIDYSTKGAGVHTFRTNTDDPQFKVSGPSNAVNYFKAEGGSTGQVVRFEAEGSDTDIQTAYISKGAGNQGFWSHAGSYKQFGIGAVASAVNYIQATGNSAGSKPSLTAQGSDTNIGLTVTTKGTGDINVNCGGTIKFRTLAGETHAAVSTSGAAGNNYPALGGGASANFYALGTDTNVNSQYWAKGTGQHIFYSSGSDTQFIVDSTDSTTNYIKLNASASSFGPTMSVQGSETVANLNYAAKSTAGHVFKNGSGNQFTIGNIASSVNWLTAIGASAGTGPRLLASGSDTNIDVRVVPKGTGKFEISGTSATSGSVTQTHYLPIKINGANYNLMLAS